MSEYRAHFDAVVYFTNGGSLSTEGFRLDVLNKFVDSSDVARLFIQHLGLALVGRVELTDLEIFEEAHKGSRGVPVADKVQIARLVDLSHEIEAGKITYPGLPTPEITPHLTREKSKTIYAPGTEFALDVITMIGNTGTYLDSPYHLHRVWG